MVSRIRCKMDVSGFGMTKDWLILWVGLLLLYRKGWSCFYLGNTRGFNIGNVYFLYVILVLIMNSVK